MPRQVDIFSKTLAVTPLSPAGGVKMGASKERYYRTATVAFVEIAEESRMPQTAETASWITAGESQPDRR